jgi:hypothetical protein
MEKYLGNVDVAMFGFMMLRLMSLPAKITGDINQKVS